MVMYQSIWLWKQRHGVFTQNVPGVDYEVWFDPVDIHRTMNRLGYPNIDRTEWVDFDEVITYARDFSRYMVRYPVTGLDDVGNFFFDYLGTMTNVLAIGGLEYFQKSKAFFTYLLDHADSEFNDIRPKAFSILAHDVACDLDRSYPVFASLLRKKSFCWMDVLAMIVGVKIYGDRVIDELCGSFDAGTVTFFKSLSKSLLL